MSLDAVARVKADEGAEVAVAAALKQRKPNQGSSATKKPKFSVKWHGPQVAALGLAKKTTGPSKNTRVHAKRMARGPDGEEKCRAKCNEMGDDKCYAFVYHKFGNCKFITKKSYGDEIDHCKRRQKSCIMNSGKGSLFHKC